jgi:hypothetical protein
MEDPRLVQLEADNTYMAKLLKELRDKLVLVDDLEDEGDRVYFASTNQADDFREAVEELDAWDWERVEMNSKGRDLYADMRELNRRLREAEDRDYTHHDYGIEANRVAAEAFGNIVRSTPGIPPISAGAVARLCWWASQLQMISAELKEEAAQYNRDGMVNEGLLTVRLQLSVEETAEWAEALASGDIEKAFNELVDISVVTDGHYHTLGLADLKVEGYGEVHGANMSKLGPDGKPLISEAGRWMKGPNTRKPDMSRVLREAEERNEPVRQGRPAS